MEKEFSIKELKVSYEEYFVADDISEGTKNKLVKTDILAVPMRYEKNEYLFAQETIDFIKYCRQNDLEHSYDVLADEVKVRSLHSFDIWMPVIWIASEVLLPIAINMVSNYIGEKIKGREKEEVQIDMTFIIKEKNNEKYIHYKGDAKTFKESFEKIDLNKM